MGGKIIHYNHHGKWRNRFIQFLNLYYTLFHYLLIENICYDRIFFNIIYHKIIGAFIFLLNKYSKMFNKNQCNTVSCDGKNRLSLILNWFNQIFLRFIRHCCVILPIENDSS